MNSRVDANKPQKKQRARQSVAPAVAARPISGGGATTLHEQIKSYVIDKIVDGTWAAAHRLPSEHDLVAQFGVSRMTVNKALRELAGTGRIVRVAGVGTFVSEAKPQSTLLQIANIGSEIRARGHDYRCHCLSQERLAAAPDVAAWLGLLPGQSVFHVLCVHLENGVPVQLEDRFVNPQLAPEFLEQDFKRTTPSEYLVACVPVDQVEHVVDAVLPTADQARRLEMSAEEPCLQLTRRTWFHEALVTWVRCLHPASRYRLGSRFRPNPDQQ
jgi:GntR family histidine utilization transcriptional repressor